MFGFFAMAYAAVRSMIDIGKDWSFEEGSRNRAKQEGRDVWVDSKGRFRNINTGHVVFTGDERVNGELHRVMRDMKTGRILRDYTVENKRRREYEDAQREIERAKAAEKRAKDAAIGNNKDKAQWLKRKLASNEPLTFEEECRYTPQKYYGGVSTASGKIKGQIYYDLETDDMVFMRYFNLVQLREVIDMSKYEKAYKDTNDTLLYAFNLYLYIDKDGKFIDYDRYFTFIMHRFWMLNWFTNKDVCDIIDKLNEKGDPNYWNDYAIRIKSPY